VSDALCVEYILEKYGNGKCLPPVTGKLNDRYCKFCIAPGKTPDLMNCPTVTHYSEGSLMPLLTMRIVTSFIPPRVPFLVRPIARGIVAALDSNYVSPELKKHLEMVGLNFLARQGFRTKIHMGIA
jgi:glutathione S-transferase